MSEHTSITERTRRRVDGILERLREETGVDCELTGLREVHEIENVERDGDGESIFEVIVVFDGDYAGGEPRPRDGEIAGLGWFSDPPDQVLYEEVRTRPYPASE